MTSTCAGARPLRPRRMGGEGSQLRRGYNAEARRVLAGFLRRVMSADLAAMSVVTLSLQDGVRIDDAIGATRLRTHAISSWWVKPPWYKEIEAVTGRSYRYVSFFEFCDAVTAGIIVHQSPVLVAYTPYRIAPYQDPEGQAWPAASNMDLLIHGGQALPGLRNGLLEITHA